VTNQVRNPMVLSGDIHFAGAAALRVGDFAAEGNPDVAYEIVTTSISSGFGDDLLPIFEAAIPKISWVSYANARKRGYAVITVTADFRVMASTAEPTSTVSTDHTDVVEAREPVTLPEEPTETTTTTTAPVGTTAPAAPGAVPVDGRATYTG